MTQPHRLWRPSASGHFRSGSGACRLSGNITRLVASAPAAVSGGREVQAAFLERPALHTAITEPREPLRGWSSPVDASEVLGD